MWKSPIAILMFHNAKTDNLLPEQSMKVAIGDEFLNF
jgi:hypothetical protein